MAQGLPQRMFCERRSCPTRQRWLKMAEVQPPLSTKLGPNAANRLRLHLAPFGILTMGDIPKFNLAASPYFACCHTFLMTGVTTRTCALQAMIDAVRDRSPWFLRRLVSVYSF